MAAGAFTLSFDSWRDIPRCATGRPNTVGNPRFVISDVPGGTTRVRLELVDLDAPGYDHGGATLQLAGDAAVPEGLFTYRSPCPPSGSHTYEWRAQALDGSGNILARDAVRRRYPE